MTELAWSAALRAAERGLLPDAAIRSGIRKLCAARIRTERQRNLSGADSGPPALSTGPIAPVPERANEQHYEVPPEFFVQALGPRLKYSCCYWPAGVSSLEEAEQESLRITCRRAGLADGQRILELGCGWGSLSLWMAECFPNARITAVSNSAPQRSFIESRAERLGVSNLQVVTCDMNDFQAGNSFDRIVSVEMFEHMRNYRELLRRVASWLEADGKLFVHIFCHRRYAYEFETTGATNWLGRHFFTGGMMPSFDMFGRFEEQMRLIDAWKWSGSHYERTANAWLENLDRRQQAVKEALQTVYGQEADRWVQRWRIFFMACAELWGYDEGREWLVGHYLLERPAAGRRCSCEQTS